MCSILWEARIVVIPCLLQIPGRYKMRYNTLAYMLARKIRTSELLPKQTTGDLTKSNISEFFALPWRLPSAKHTHGKLHQRSLTYGSTSHACQGGPAGAAGWGRPMGSAKQSWLSDRAAHSPLAVALPALPPFPICVSIFPGKVALSISLILLPILGWERWCYPRFNGSCVLQITGL
jgi:hypothetical protein